MSGKEIVSEWWVMTVLSQDDINATDLRALAVMIDAALASAHEDVRALAEALRQALVEEGYHMSRKMEDKAQEALARPSVRKIVEGR